MRGWSDSCSTGRIPDLRLGGHNVSPLSSVSAHGYAAVGSGHAGPCTKQEIRLSTQSDIERWIRSNLSPRQTTTAELAYERMESQSGECLVVLYQPLDHTRRAHWHDVAIVSAFARAMGGAESVLDIGPGDGWPSLRMADRFSRITGIDPSPRRVRIQRENAARLGIENVEFLVMDAEAMSLKDASFDGVCAASSIEQCDDPAAALAEAHRVLRPGGTLAMVFEDYSEYFPESDGDEEIWMERARGADGSDERILFYQLRTKSPPREARYGLFLDGVRLAADPELSRVLEAVVEKPVSLDLRSDSASKRPHELSLPFFETLAPYVISAACYELNHLTGRTLDELLESVGFGEIRHLDHRIPSVLEAFNTAESEERLDECASTFVEFCEDVGARAMDDATPGQGDFVIARKSPN